jgi:hypothetical protein
MGKLNTNIYSREKLEGSDIAESEERYVGMEYAKTA